MDVLWFPVLFHSSSFFTATSSVIFSSLHTCTLSSTPSCSHSAHHPRSTCSLHAGWGSSELSLGIPGVFFIAPCACMGPIMTFDPCLCFMADVTVYIWLKRQRWRWARFETEGHTWSSRAWMFLALCSSWRKEEAKSRWMMLQLCFHWNGLKCHPGPSRAHHDDTNCQPTVMALKEKSDPKSSSLSLYEGGALKQQMLELHALSGELRGKMSGSYLTPATQKWRYYYRQLLSYQRLMCVQTDGRTDSERETWWRRDKRTFNDLSLKVTFWSSVWIKDLTEPVLPDAFHARVLNVKVEVISALFNICK